MKKYMLFLALACLGWQAVAQLPLPCVRYANGLDLQGFNGQMEVNCLTIDLGQNSYTIADDNYRGFEVDNATIEPGSNGENTGIQILPGVDPNSGFQISLRAAGGGDDELTGAWFEPSDSYEVPLYEKAEWGMILPADIETAIDNWIYNDENPGSNLTPALNPFDPDQIDLWAEITIGGVTKRLNGFFYIPFERNTTNPDKNYWDWDELPNDYRFRFRYSPETMGFHFITVHCNVPGYGQWEHVPFVFNATWNDPRKSFVSVTSNGHYFQTVDGHVIIPIGINHNDLSYSCECYGEGSADCTECYVLGDNDPCCGISSGYKSRRFNNADPNYHQGSELKSKALPLVAYIKRDMQIAELKQNGATAVRIWNDPIVSEIEFEKLTNYYERQYQGWEFDNYIEKCHEEGLRIQWCQMMHYNITKNSEGAGRWDWNHDNKYWDYNPDEGAYCYWTEFGEEEPIDFFTDPNAIYAFKKKLRYMIARWGYSSDIFLIDLISEVNNLGHGQKWLEGVDLDQNGEEDEETIGKPYDVQRNIVRPAVAAWHEEIARYIKEDLDHSQHLISADYTGRPQMTGSNCSDPDYDYSWDAEHIDVIAYSNYNKLSSRWERNAIHNYSELQCMNGTSVTNYGNLTKPVVFAENGAGDYMECDQTVFLKDMLSTPFSGQATGGMSWSQIRTPVYWFVMGKINNFLEAFLLNTHDIGTELWIPQHDYSNDDGLNNDYNDGRAEAVFLSKVDSENPKYIGIILNRTWNYFSVNDVACGDNILPSELEGENFNEIGTVQQFGWGDEKLRLSNATNANYTIRYYNPYTLEEVNEVNNQCADGTLDLEDYPLMFDGTDGYLPFYFFIAFEEGSEWDEMPVHDNKNDTHSYSSRFDNHNDNPETGLNTEISTYTQTNTLKIYPNPTTSNLCAISPQLFNYNIIDSYGKIISSGILTQGLNILDIKHLSPGIYAIHCIETSENHQFVVN